MVFGLCTYIFNPYTEELDRWLEFMGRGLVILVAAGASVNYDLFACCEVCKFRLLYILCAILIRNYSDLLILCK